jgi:FAD/FMN-containing dehydrogenase
VTATTEIETEFSGEILRPKDGEYEDARKVFNAMIDRRPALIARCADPVDVIAALGFGRDKGIPIAVRCGGHSVSGLSVCDGGIVIDLGLMRAVRVDPIARRAWVQGGCLLRDVDRETQIHGLATTGGVISHTGVGGLTLGGGYGYLGRRFGMACDNVVSAEVVTANGEVLTASADQNADLYWGIRGGGGNFGVVTNFEFQLHPYGPDILNVDLAYRMDDGHAAVRRLLTLAENAPDPFVAGASVVTGRPSPDLPDDLHGKPMVWVSFTYAGDVEEGRRLVPALKGDRVPLVESVEVMPYVRLQRIADEAQRHGLRQYAKSHFIRATPDAFIEALLGRGGVDPSLAANASMGQLGGAIARIGEDETAFNGRDALFDLVVTSTWEDPGFDEDRIAAARAFGASIEPLSTGRSYVNAIEDAETDKVRAAFGARIYDGLAVIKAKYDPDNVFHLNQNVRPAPPS